jgi:TATA-box binding protein (TBP) (component of TFIID and TFIIIB)
MIKSKIVDVVATATLNQTIDLDEIGQVNEFLHDSEIYGGCVAYFKTPEMQGKVSIFATGKMISIGTKSEVAAFGEIDSAKRFLVKKSDK